MKRMKITDQGCYYHLMNRITGQKGRFPFDDADKEYGFRLLQNLSEYFLVEIISAAWMGNHFHLVVYAPGPDAMPSPQEIADRHNAYYKSMEGRFTYFYRTMPYISSRNKKQCLEIGAKMLDISYFMRAFQQRFSRLYNKQNMRRGRLWADRFKSVLLDDKRALEACIQYVELNPVRAGLVESPRNYPFTTWGRYFSAPTGHPFRENFLKHYKKILTANEVDTSEWKDLDYIRSFHQSLQQIIAKEQDVDAAERDKTEKQIRRKESMPMRFLQRTRHFTDGAIIGSKQFIREMGSKFKDPSKVAKKQLSRGFDPHGTAIYCFRKLRE